MTKISADHDRYEVVICGAGLAGLTFGLLLRRRWPDLSVLLIDRLARPLPEAAFKVGESTVEVGAHYLAEWVGLRSYLERRHFHKLGLRYFFGDPGGRFEERPELGLSAFPPVTSYQIDRGRLESDLRDLAAAAGIELLEGCRVEAIDLGEGERPHCVRFRSGPGGDHQTVQARWLVDAMGRRRFLQSQLGLQRSAGERHDAAWFRVAGRLDLDDLVPAAAAAWHQRVPGRGRYFSTNHLMGDGYWVWLIPLASGHTSVGIVTRASLHPLAGFSTAERARAWLEDHEPTAARLVAGKEPVDFRRLGDYSYSSRQVFSADRWVCLGEAGVFSDPFFSPGTDVIGFGSLLACELIEADRTGCWSPPLVDQANAILLTLNDGLIRSIQLGYPFFGRAVAAAAKLIWDVVSGWSLTAPQMFNPGLLDPVRSAAVRRITGPYLPLADRVLTLLEDWAERPGRGSFEFIDYLAIPFVRELRRRNLETLKSTPELLADHAANMETLEELAQALFLLAVEDTMPEELGRFAAPVWLDAWAMGLDPGRWEADGLFRPRTPRRDLSRVWTPLRRLFTFAPAAVRHARAG